MYGGKIALQKEKQETISYTIEREFLSKLTVAELVSRIIRSHIHKNGEKKEATT